jgi:hypothetical protein
MLPELVFLLFATPDIPQEALIRQIPEQRALALREARLAMDVAISNYQTLLTQEIGDAPRRVNGMCGDWGPGWSDGNEAVVLIFRPKDCPPKTEETNP